MHKETKTRRRSITTQHRARSPATNPEEPARGGDRPGAVPVAGGEIRPPADAGGRVACPRPQCAGNDRPTTLVRTSRRSPATSYPRCRPIWVAPVTTAAERTNPPHSRSPSPVQSLAPARRRPPLPANLGRPARPGPSARRTPRPAPPSLPARLRSATTAGSAE